jgi:hypothetical protein
MQTATIRRLLGPLAVIGVLAGLMAAAPAANAKIVVGQSIAGVKLGDSQAQVKALLGKPSSCDPSCGVHARVWRYVHGFSGVIEFDTRGHVHSMWTGSSRQSTSKGIHAGAIGKPGSSLADIKAAYPSATCEELPNSGGFASCDVFTHAHGHKVDTNFLIKATFAGVAEIAVNDA